MMRSLPPFRRFAPWLALAALALQIIVSFGHVHLHGVRGSYPATAVTAFTAQVAPLAAPQPGDNEDDGYCALCASIFLAATSFVPQPPALPVPLVSRPIEHRVDTFAAAIAPRRMPFQSRAPPLV